MAPRRQRLEPTAAELKILSTLWRLGPSTVRQVHDELSKRETTGYTTVLKLLQIMLKKGLVRRDDSRRPHVYTPATSQGQTQKHLLRGLLDRAFDGSAKSLVVQALSSGKVSAAELDEIRQLIADLERREGP
ncbi:MAG: BlaI/MecI/CopY family transcriptional regulator [Planctomycetota bacterium]|jgi:predicted transcriptional regulator